MQENFLVDNMNDKFYPRLSCALSECSYQCPSRDCELGDVEGCQECETEWKIETEEIKKKKKCYQRFQEGIEHLVEHKYFQRGILLAILFNTLSMGIEYHNQPEGLTRALETSNIIFSILFAVEMLMKLLAFGLLGYIKNGFNVFDGFIVILSLVELTQQGGASGLSVLRTFRLLRILKLVRFMPALRRQLVVMLRTMDNVATFFALLVLFMFIFSVLGMNVFGGKFCWKEDGSHCTCKEALDIANDCECDRANFNTLLWALVTVFQVLTQEDWNTVLYNGMEKTSPWAALYFVALMTFGNYVLFNLLVAILVEGFSSEEEEKKRIKENKNKMKEDEQLEANNNNEQIKDSLKHLDVESGDMKINNKEKEKMLGLTQAVKEKTVVICTVPPPIITHTEATPMATPQGSPHEHGVKELNKSCLAIRQSTEMNTLTVEIPIINTPRASPHLSRASSLRSSSRSSSRSVSFKGSTRLSARVSPRPSPRPSPRLWRSFSYGSRSRNSWKFKRAKDGDKTKLVYKNDTDRDDCIDIDDDENDDDEVFQSNSCLSQKAHDRHQFKSHECNGDIPLNNQRIVRSQNCLLQRRSSSPRNPIRSRNNSSSSAHSVCNSIYLRRQNTFPVRHKCKSLSSTGSGLHSDDYKQNNLSDSGERRESNVPAEEEKKEAEEEDPDAMDEANCSWSWCPEPKGCFKTRNEYSLYIFSPENTIRKFSHHVMTQRWFDNTVLFFIALNCITLAMERPDIPPDSPEREFLTYSNYVFTVIFMLEMTIKVLSKGLLIGKHAYLKSGWNIMDGALVVISLVDILITLQAQSSPRIFGILRVFRLLRTLRPLRVISRAPGLKLVVQTLLSSLRPIGNIVLICCTFFIIFGILGVQLFKGTFYYCKGPNIRHVSNKTQCLADRRNVWINQKYNFDDLGQALMALFVLASKDGWVSIMYTGLDAVGVDQQPIVNYSELRLIYFISFLLLVGFFVLNMFVGVVVENFHKCREDQEKEEKARRMAKRERKLDQKRQKLKQTPYWADYSRSRLLIYTVINSKYFDLAIAGVIGLNVITMAMEYYMMPEELKFALKIFNYFFTSVFILEAAMKVISLGWIRYFRDRWNQLDMLIVVLSIVGIVLEEMETNVIPINPTIIRVMRVLRIARVLKLLKMAKGIRALLDTVIQALPQVGNLGLLFFLLFFIFAALGVELFGRLECSEEHPCDGLSDHAHFKNFGMAFLTLFRVATGDNWNGILKDTLRTDCDDSDNCLNNCCVNPIIAPVYFVIFVLMAQFVLVNVVVAVLMKHLEETYKYKEMDDEMEDELKQEIEDIEKCQKATEAIEMARMQEMQRMELDEGETEGLLNCNTDSDVQIEITSNDGLSQNTPRNTFPLMPPSLTLRPPSSEPIEPDNIPSWEDSQDKYDYNLLNPSSIKLGIMNSSERDTFPTRISPTLGEGTYHIDIPQITVPELTSIRNRRPVLVRQYSQEVSTGSPEQTHSLSPQRKSHSFEETDHEVKSTLHAHSHPLLGKSVNSGVKLQSGIHFLSDPDQMIKDSTRCKSRKSHIFRSASSGTDHSRLKERYQKFPKQHSQNDVSHSNTTINIIKTSISSLKETIGSQCTLSSEQLADDQYTLIDWEEDELFCDEEVKRITGEANEEVDHEEQYPERELNCDISKDSKFYKRSTCCDNSGFRSNTQDENRLNHRDPELNPGIQHYAAFDNRKEKLTMDRRHLSKSDSLTIPGDKSENVTLGVDVCKCSSLDDSIQSGAKPQQKDVTESSHLLTSDILTEKKHVFHTRSHVT
ncbi:hypothetical protein CHS0354_041799 [Potamilus streckersoni]|uniref:Ion transport domain-containing protein n=1 Tax=Potamilus streckersoni TaxID=2493646 RepID=A0AAE0T2C0_9BIVA|nr:hypothetical protein CHS0354_041799 [Potamilus streckersoni]